MEPQRTLREELLAANFFKQYPGYYSLSHRLQLLLRKIIPLKSNPLNCPRSQYLFFREGVSIIDLLQKSLTPLPASGEGRQSVALAGWGSYF